MREHIPQPVRKVLSPLRRGGFHLVRRGMRAATRHVGVVADYDYLFVLTYGRSGSTLLAGLLNTIPGYRVRGENYSALYRIYQADAAIAKARESFSGADHLSPLSPWYGTPRVRENRFRAGLLNNFVGNVLRPEPGDRVLGFKEIRYAPSHIPDLDEYLAWLHRVFPAPKIVINHRDPAAVARSGWWPDKRDAERTIRTADERLWKITADARHHHFVYDDIDDGLANVRALFDFLGEPMDEPAVRQALGTKHSAYPATEGK
jgi:hypothetical protein